MDEVKQTTKDSQGATGSYPFVNGWNNYKEA